MTLLLSTAHNLFWLGRYMRRTMALEQQLRQEDFSFVDDEQPQLIQLISHFEHVNDNVQAVRGVIDQDAFEMFNSIRRLRTTDNYRAACFQLYACEEAMRAQEYYLSLFWRLGDAVERIDCQLRANQITAEDYHHLAEVATELPAATTWDRLKQPAQALFFNRNAQQYYAWVGMVNSIFEDGV